MADIQFEEDPQYGGAARFGQEKPFFIRLVLATGIVSTDKQAEYVLLGVAVFLLILAFLVPSFFGSSSLPQVPQSVIDAAMKVPRR